MQAVYCRDREKSEPVNDFIDALAPERQEELDIQDQPSQPALLEQTRRSRSRTAPKSTVSSRELRCHYGRNLYRILYQRSGNLFVLLHALEKRTGALPQADIDIAKARFVDFKQRMDVKRRRPPRPAGQHAP